MSRPVVVFDCAGTLLRQEPAPADVFTRVAAQAVGVKLDRGAVLAAYRMTDFSLKQSAPALHGTNKKPFYDMYNKLLCLALGLDGHYAALNPALQQAFRQDKQWVPFDDVPKTLEVLSGAQTPMHVVSNWDQNLVEVLEAAQLAGFFESISPSAALGAEKPDPEVFEALWNKGIHPDQAIYVGDDYALDIVCARQAGLRPILIDREGRYSASDCERLASLTELIAILGLDAS